MPRLKPAKRDKGNKANLWDTTEDATHAGVAHERQNLKRLSTTSAGQRYQRNVCRERAGVDALPAQGTAAGWHHPCDVGAAGFHRASRSTVTQVKSEYEPL